MKHKAQNGEFEEKEGALNKRASYGVADTVKKMLMKNGYRCNIGCHNASGLKSKKARILSCRSEILGIETDYSYKIYCKDPSIRYNDSEYNNFVRHIMNWSDEDAMFVLTCFKDPKSDVFVIFNGISDEITQQKLEDFEIVGDIHDPEWQKKLNLKDE